MAIANQWARALARAGARARARAGALARARAGARARAWTRARARAHRKTNVTDWLILADANPGEISMWNEIKIGCCVMLEMPARWYVGVVKERTSMTAILEAPALCVHYIDDLGLWMSGKPGKEAEYTPLPGGIEISLAALESVQPYEEAVFRRICKRSHEPAEQ